MVGSRHLMLLPVGAALLALSACDDPAARVGGRSSTTQAPAAQPQASDARAASAKQRDRILLDEEEPAAAPASAAPAAAVGENPLELANVNLDPSDSALTLHAELPFDAVAKSIELGALKEEAPFRLAHGYRHELVTSRVKDPGLLAHPHDTVMNQTDGDGYEPGRFLFRVHRSAADAGITRTDLTNGQTQVVAQSGKLRSLSSLRWTPWGTLLAASQVGENQGSLGRAYEIDPFPELRNTAASDNAQPLPNLGVLAFNGVELAPDGAIYFVDHADKGGIYKFVPTATGKLDAGTLHVLKTDDASSDLGAAKWVAMDAQALTDARAAAAAVGATGYLHLASPTLFTTAKGKTFLYVSSTGAPAGHGGHTGGRVLSVELTDAPVVREFITLATIDGSTGLAVGDAFQSPASLAVAPSGLLVVAESADSRTLGNDLWGAVDVNEDGVADRIGRFASLATFGAQPTGLCFDPFQQGRLFVNVSGPQSLNDSVFLVRMSSPALPVAHTPVSPLIAGGEAGGFIPAGGFLASNSFTGGYFAAAALTGDEDEGETTGEDEGTTAGEDEGETTGEDEGMTTGEDEGETTGEDEGTTTGEDEGETTGEDEGTTTGEDEGETTGEDEGETTGEDEGETTGEDEGETTGEDEGETTGEDEGETTGEDEGENDGPTDGNNESGVEIPDGGEDEGGDTGSGQTTVPEPLSVALGAAAVAALALSLRRRR